MALGAEAEADDSENNLVGIAASYVLECTPQMMIPSDGISTVIPTFERSGGTDKASEDVAGLIEIRGSTPDKPLQLSIKTLLIYLVFSLSIENLPM